MSCRQWIVALAITFCSIQGGLAQSLDAKRPQPGEIPISCDGSVILLNVSHSRGNYRFMLDTGSPWTLLDKTTFHSILKPTELERSIKYGWPAGLGYENPGDLVVEGGFPLPATPFYRIDISNFWAYIGEDVHGVVGCDFLDQFAVDVDADAGYLRLSKKAENTQGACFDLSRDKEGRPVLKTTLAELAPELMTADFGVDTGLVGLPGVSLEKVLFRSYLAQGLMALEGTAHSTQIEKLRIERYGRLQDFTVHKKFSDIQVRERAGHQMNLLGLSYLMQFNFTIDLPNSKLYLRPRKSPPRLLELKDMSGLELLRPSTGMIARRVEPLSPASKAGMRVGDIITSVDGTASEKLPLQPLRMSLCEAGKVVRLGIRRDAKTWTVDIELADWRKPAIAADFE